MTEERAIYETTPPTRRVKAVRLEDFRDDPGHNWQSFLSRPFFARYPGAKIVSRRPQVAVVELRTGSVWSEEDEAFFTAMRTEGYFQRWETLTELPPVSSQARRSTYEDIGYRIGEGKPLTPAQSAALLSFCHDQEERAVYWETDAKEQRLYHERAQEAANRLGSEWNALVHVLDTELAIKVYHHDEWTAEDAASGRILARDTELPALYRKALRLRLGGGKA